MALNALSKLSSWCVGLGCLLGPQASAQEQVTYQLTSQNCGQIDHRLVNDSLVLEFFDLGVESLDGQYDSRNCLVQADVRIPFGKKFKPIQAFVDGEVATSAQGEASIYFDYIWQGKVCKKDHMFGPGLINQTFFLKSPRAEAWEHSACSQGDLVQSLSGHFNIAASSSPQDTETSALALFNAERQFVSKWEWNFVDCYSPLWANRTFRSRYTNPNGRWIQGQTVLYGDRGSYVTDSGYRGRLFNIEYYENGRVAQGLWEFENGQRGWFRFYLGFDHANFTGTWGHGDVIDQNPLGQWKGYL